MADTIELDGFSPERLLKGQIQRKTTTLAKQFLFFLEDLRDEGAISEEKYQRGRKRVLDYLGECHREIFSAVDQLDVKLKK